ncbi:expressed unknown protein (Partial), partial [Seminavis robusta]|eukprot:Sro950_g223800.1 n/a (536) ;mRNA; f:40032-41640
MKDNLLRATRSRSPSPPGSISSNIGRVPSREDFSHSSHRKTFQSRLVQSLLVLLGVTVAVHHLLLTSPLLQSMVGAGRENEDAPQKQQRALLGDGMSLESLSSSVATSQLSVAEKEGLLRTIEQLTQQKLRQGMPTAAPTASPTVSPTASPTASPTVAPTASPTASPTANPTSKATEEVVVTAKNHSAVITVSDPQINLTETAAVTINNLTPKSPYAYMFVIGGIHEDRPAYKGFVYDVLVATRLLRKLGSTADVVLFTQMSPDSPLDALPQEDTDHLHALNIQIIPLPKPNRESFAGLVFEKFRALQLVQYRRVMFMDADAIPLANLDYMFHLSDADHKSTPTFLKPNMIWATRGEPCNAGLFMLEPEAGGWERLQAIIRRMKEEGKQLPYPHFSWNRGWGYDFEAENDEWHGTIKYGKKWRYHAGHSDQGLLYYWTKFYKRNVSIIIQDKIENWIDAGVNANKTIDGFSKPTLEMNLRLEPLGPYSHENPLVHQFNCDEEKHQQASKYKKPHQCVVPYRDIAHFMGGSKPWMIP